MMLFTMLGREARIPHQRTHCRAAATLVGILLAVAGPSSLYAQSTLRHQIQRTLTKLPHTQTVAGVCVLDLTTNTIVYAKNADLPLIPASNMKIFAMAAALAELGPDFAFQTILATDTTNLYLIGDGDPALGDEKLSRRKGQSTTALWERWAALLREHGLATIAGDLILDESLFDQEPLHPDWEASDLGKWYAAPVGALNFNDNVLDFTVTPANRPDAPVTVLVKPPNTLVEIINQCRTGGKGHPILHHPAGTFTYRITGRCQKRWRFGPVAFPDPGLFTANTLETVLAQHGVTIEGNIRRQRVRQADGQLPPSLWVLATHRTPLTEVLRRAGKNSQNLFAECLLKRTGYAWARRRGENDPQGSWRLGSQAVIDTLRHHGIDTAGLVVADGSGLSRKNRCSARQLATVLAWSQAIPGAGLFHSSLAGAGTDGSLRKRLENLAGRVYAKTGTLRRVSALSGFVDARSGTRYAFSIIFNGYKGPSTPYREIQDRICRIISRHANE